MSCNQTAIAQVYIDFAESSGSDGTIEFIIKFSAGLAKEQVLTAQGYTEVITELVVHFQFFHPYMVRIIGCLEIHVVTETTGYGGGIIDLGLGDDLHTAIPFILSIAGAIIFVALVETHTSVAGPGNVANFLFQVGNANAQVGQFVSVFASQFVQGCTLFSVQRSSLAMRRAMI